MISNNRKSAKGGYLLMPGVIAAQLLTYPLEQHHNALKELCAAQLNFIECE